MYSLGGAGKKSVQDQPEVWSKLIHIQFYNPGQ